jgi:hypothetical protein
MNTTPSPGANAEGRWKEGASLEVDLSDHNFPAEAFVEFLSLATASMVNLGNAPMTVTVNFDEFGQTIQRVLFDFLDINSLKIRPFCTVLGVKRT